MLSHHPGKKNLKSSSAHFNPLEPIKKKVITSPKFLLIINQFPYKFYYKNLQLNNQECMFVDSGFIIIEEFTSTKFEDWNFDISSLHNDLIVRCKSQLFHVTREVTWYEQNTGGYTKWSCEILKEKAADLSHESTQGERVYPVCIQYVAGYCSASSACSGHTVYMASYHKPFNTLKTQG